MREFLPMTEPPLTQPLRLTHLLSCDRMRPRLADAKSGCGFLSGESARCFNDGADRMAQLPRVFLVGVVDAPELVACRDGFIHRSSEAEGQKPKMYQPHKMRGQSGECPFCGRNKCVR